MMYIHQIQRLVQVQICTWFIIYTKKELQNAIPFSRATDGVRTRDPDLGKVVLYQLSHCRVSLLCSSEQ